MVEKRRGLGRGLGALIPSAPAEEEQVLPAAEPTGATGEVSQTNSNDRKQGGRPVDLFFERVTEDDVAEQPRSYSSALRSGINKNVLDAQTKRVGKTARKAASGVAGRQPSKSEAGNNDEPTPAVDPPMPTSPEFGEQSEVPALDAVEPTAAMDSVVSQRPQHDQPLQLPTSDPDSRGKEEGSLRRGPAGSTERVSRETSSSDASEGAVSAMETRGAGAAEGLVEVPGASFADLPLDAIHPNRKQPRVEFNEDELSELVHSIREIGVLQPIVVRPSQEPGEPRYELVMGERRWRASREAGMETIPAIIRVTLDDDLLRDALLENLHRSALNPLEEAAAYQQLLEDFGCSHDELAGRLGRSRPQISNTLRLMKLPPLVQRRVAAGVLSAGHARALLGLADPVDMEKLAQRIVAEGLSVRSTEEIVALSGGLRRASKPSTPKDGARHERLDYLATSLADRLDTSVKITLGAKKGRVSIEFASVDDLNRIIGVLAPTAE
jgi:ParB family chromosome partitioning protein